MYRKTIDSTADTQDGSVGGFIFHYPIILIDQSPVNITMEEYVSYQLIKHAQGQRQKDKTPLA
jgi:hypothetical protein